MRWLHLFGTWIAGLALLGSLLSTSLVRLDYTLRYDYIAQELCENKAMPELQCNGKCVLAKKLKAAQANPPSDASAPEITYRFFAVWMPVPSNWQWNVAFFSGNHPARHAGEPMIGFPSLPWWPPVG